MLRAVHMLKIHQDIPRAELNSYSYMKFNFCVVYCTGKKTFFLLKTNKQTHNIWALHNTSVKLGKKKKKVLVLE